VLKKNWWLIHLLMIMVYLLLYLPIPIFWLSKLH